MALCFSAQFPRYSVWGCSGGKLKTNVRETVRLKTATVLFARKVDILKLVWGGRGVRMPQMYFPYIRSSFTGR